MRLRLSVTTPTEVVVQVDDVAAVRAEDETGAFGILPGHTCFLTALTVSVLSWRDGAGAEGHVAVRGGVLAVRDGRWVEVATREAVRGDNLHQLEHNVLAAFRETEEREKEARSATARLHLAAIRHIHRYLNPPEAGGAAAPQAVVGERTDG